MRSLLLRSVPVLLGVVLIAACAGRTPAGIPPTATGELPTGVPTAALPISGTPIPAAPAIIATAVVTATATPTATLAPAQVVALEALNIRSGPGLEYPVEGWLAAGAGAAILGRSPDGAWWRIQCPAGLQTAQCWIIASDTLAQAVNATAVATAAVPAVPPTSLPTAPPTPTPCVVSRPAGWVSYQVRSGDTLSSIAGATGASVGALMSANCLASDVIVAGSSLWAPGGGAPVAGAQATEPTSQGVVVPLGVEASFKLVQPGKQPCPIGHPTATTADLQIHIGETAKVPKVQWEIAEDVCIYLANAISSISVTVTLPTGELRSAERISTDRWRYIPRPGDPAGEGRSYTVAAVQAGTVATRTFEVRRVPISATPRIRVLPPQWVQPGRGAIVLLAGFRSGTPLYLYSLNYSGKQQCIRPSCKTLTCTPTPTRPASAPSSEFCLIEELPWLTADNNGELEFVLWTRNRPVDTYLVHTGQPEPDDNIAQDDPRILVITIPE